MRRFLFRSSMQPIFWLIVLFFNLTQAQRPSPRWANDCVLVGSQLYCYSGATTGDPSGEDSTAMYALDLGAEWSTGEPAWHALKQSNMARWDPAGRVGSAYFSAVELPDQKSMVVHGGQSPYQTMVYAVESNSWSVPSIRGPQPSQRIQHTATSDNQGRIWIWGGQSSDTTTTPVPGQVVRSAFDNRWAVIDTSTWTYSYPDIPNAPPARIDHTATLAGDGNIYIIGGLMYSRNVTDPTGQQTLNPVSMSSLLKFDAASSQWQNVTATGNIPAPRGGHSATLSSDGTAIIVFGGGTVDDGESNLLNDVFVLELATMRWSAPSITGLPPSPRKYHYARLVGPESLLVCFGLTDVLATSDVNLLDLRTGSWVTTYTPDAAWLAGNATALALNNTLHLTNDSLTTNSTLHPTNDTRPTQTATASSITLSSAITKGTGENEPSHVGAGILAGVISGGVVVIGGAALLFVSTVVFRRRRASPPPEALESAAPHKPHFRSSFEEQKPNERV